MITHLKLKNFKTHQDLDITFGSGLQTIRGEVEAGKSSMIEGIAFGFFGAAALPLSLADTVTWGFPESSLRVEIDFLHAGSPFSLYRAKSGAELTGAGVRVSGAAEVTKFCEGLFGCTAAVAKNVLLASQGDLRGALEGGPGEAVQLIERLGNVGLLDTIIGKIQDQLPSGNTASLEALIAREAAVEPPAAPDPSLNQVLQQAQMDQAAADETYLEVEQALAEIDIAGANQVLGAWTAATDRLARAKTTSGTHARALAGAGDALRDLLAKPTPDLVAIAEAKAAADNLARVISVRKQFDSLLAKSPEDIWDRDARSMDAEISRLVKSLNDLKADGQAEAVKVARLQAQVITETACGLCGKDLRNVPEVVAKNAGIEALVAKSTERQRAIKAEYRDINETLQILEVLKVHHNFANDLATREPVLVRYSAESAVPGLLEWIGPADLTPSTRNFARELSEARAHQDQLSATQALVDRTTVLWDSAIAEIAVLEAELSKLDVVAAGAVLESAKALQERVKACASICRQARTTVQQADAALRESLQAHQSAVATYDKAQESLAGLKRDLAAMRLHNQVIKRIREVRPAVADQVWSLVLSTISQYFSKIRGTQSAVLRGDKGFTVDGHSAKALSGSTKDSLGLAIRLALAKTFLPNLGFLILDEPAAACSDTRESAMLGLLSSTDFDQILMVTHSDLADAFSTNIIQL